MIEPSQPFRYPDEDDTRPATERGDALRGIMEVIGKGRTARARLLRLETLAMIVRAGNAAQTPAEIAERLACSLRRVEQVHRELRDFVFGMGN